MVIVSSTHPGIIVRDTIQSYGYQVHLEVFSSSIPANRKVSGTIIDFIVLDAMPYPQTRLIAYDNTNRYESALIPVRVLLSAGGLLESFYGLRPLPPWRVMVSPVTYSASELARNTHTRPMSFFGSAKWPSGMPWMVFSYRSG